MLNIEYNPDNPFSSADKYEIISFAIKIANNDGFINSFILTRALYIRAVTVIDPDREEEIFNMMVEQNIFDTWDALVQDGTMEFLFDKYKPFLDELAAEAEDWFKEYIEYKNSISAMVSALSDISDQLVGGTAAAFKNGIDSSNVQEVLNIADYWGMNNGLSEVKDLPDLDPQSDTIFDD